MPRNRTGSSGSRVPPAVTTHVPAGAGRRRARRRRGPARRPRPEDLRGSGSRPGPVSAPVSRPDAGSSTSAPRPRSVATLSWVAGCCHISVCMAGANSTGQRAVSRVAVSRSSARPAAARASRSAVAGATTTRSAGGRAGRAAPRAASSQTSVGTGLAGQRGPGGLADEMQRGRGRDHPDLVAGLGQQPQQLAGLVGGDARHRRPGRRALGACSARRTATAGQAGRQARRLGR